MKILVVSQHYYPENFLITKICEGLVERGHEVTVVTGTPNYPQGKIYAGYEKGKKKEKGVKCKFFKKVSKNIMKTLAKRAKV